MEKIKMAVMGFENGHCYYIYQALKGMEEVEIVAVSFSPRARIVYENRLGRDYFNDVDIFYDDEEMLKAHPEIQACVCGGSNFRHMKEFRLCAERGIHVISMKAPTYDMAEYDEMLRLKEKYGIVVHIELEMRWKATVQRIRKIVADGDLGTVRAFHAYNYSHYPMWWYHWMDIPEESYGKRIAIRPGDRHFRGGALTDHPHIFDLTRYMFDTEFDTIYAEAAPNMRDGAETEDLVYVIGRLKNGIVFSLDPSYANREPEQARVHGFNLSRYPRPVQVEMQVTGDKGTLYCDSYEADYIEYLEPDTQIYRVVSPTIPLDDQRHMFFGQFFADVREGKDRAFVPLKEHKKTIQAINAAYDSIYRGEPVKVNTEE